MNALQAIERKLKADKAPELLIGNFLRHAARAIAKESGFIGRSTVVPPTALTGLDDLAARIPDGFRALASTVVIKLNGGLGTSMGLEKAKSLLPVKNGMRFIDIIAEQILHLRGEHRAALPLLLMNSYSTDADSLAALDKYPALAAGQSGVPLSFLQHRVPKLRADTFEPVAWPADPGKDWCPPGHGDLFTALATSGLLNQLAARGIRYAFVSNADNLGATLDPALLGHLAHTGCPFIMEVTDRTPADRKGGHLAARKEGGLLLREIAQCPETEVDDFQDIATWRFFNTNNLWIDLQAVRNLLAAGGQGLDLPTIVNRKTVDPRDKNSTPVLQLETAMGSAIAVFPGAQAIRVPRSRFAPVKTTDDLLALWSDAYVLTPERHVRLSPARKSPPDIKLDPRHYKLVDQFALHFAKGIPSLIACDSLKIEGDVSFGPGVVCRGRVSIVEHSPSLLKNIELGAATQT